MRFPNAVYAVCPGCGREVFRRSDAGSFVDHRTRARDPKAPWCDKRPPVSGPSTTGARSRPA